MSSHATARDAVVSRDRLFVLAGLVGVSALAWGYTVELSDHTAGVVGATAVAHAHSWAAADLAMTFVMWGVMMVAMMAPTAGPMLLTLARVGRARSAGSNPLACAASFLLGYLLVWTGFSFAASLAQWGLHELTLVSASGASNSLAFGGLLLLGAGGFQLTPLKQACLSRCRSPLLFLMTEWRAGLSGALHMGLRHGVYCVGCCWALMALMFVAGTMNLLWAAALMLLMLAEKALPSGRLVGRSAGVGLVGCGLYVLGAGVIGA